VTVCAISSRPLAAIWCEKSCSMMPRGAGQQAVQRVHDATRLPRAQHDHERGGQRRDLDEVDVAGVQIIEHGQRADRQQSRAPTY